MKHCANELLGRGLRSPSAFLVVLMFVDVRSLPGGGGASSICCPRVSSFVYRLL